MRAHGTHPRPKQTEQIIVILNEFIPFEEKKYHKKKNIRIKAKIPNRIFCLSGENAHKKMESRTNGNKNSEKQNKT